MNYRWKINNITHLGRKTTISFRLLACAVLAMALLSSGADVYAFAYVGSYEPIPNRVVHPTDYHGIGGTLNLSVAIAPDTPRSLDMIESINRVIETWNLLEPTLNNIEDHTTNPITSIQFDFQSVLLHEVGHTLGLAHPNAASESGLLGDDMDYTKSAMGNNNKWDLDPGEDGIIGSADDERKDDVNFNWFNTANNNPFSISEIVDSTTYSSFIDDLPSNDSYSANASRDVAALVMGNLDAGFVSEAVMQQGAYPGEIQRQLSFDDVAGVMYANSGIDEISNTIDDYTINLHYVGYDNLADIVITFDNSSDFASTTFATSRIGFNANHQRISPATILFNDTINWYFTLPEGCIEGDIDCDGTVGLLDLDILGKNYGETGMSRFEGDLSGNGIVSLIDLDILGMNFRRTSIPEPTTAALLAVAIAGMWRRR